MSRVAPEEPRRHRLTVADYYRMAEAGILARDARVELIEGEIIDMAPTGSRHSAAVDRLVERLRDAVGQKAIVRCQNPVSLDELSEPEPDIALLRRQADFYASAHPRAQDVFLIVEVADSSLAYDRAVKVPLYARHGIPEVWIVDVATTTLTRYRRPTDGAYAQVDTPDPGAAIGIDSLPGVEIGLGALLGR